MTPLAQFQTMVLQDIALQQELRNLFNRPDFVNRVVVRANERGLAVTPAEVEAALGMTLQAWIARWLDR
jgi:hypothetical protein